VDFLFRKENKMGKSKKSRKRSCSSPPRSPEAISVSLNTFQLPTTLSYSSDSSSDFSSESECYSSELEQGEEVKKLSKYLQPYFSNFTSYRTAKGHPGRKCNSCSHVISTKSFNNNYKKHLEDKHKIVFPGKDDKEVSKKRDINETVDASCRAGLGAHQIRSKHFRFLLEYRHEVPSPQTFAKRSSELKQEMLAKAKQRISQSASVSFVNDGWKVHKRYIFIIFAITYSEEGEYRKNLVFAEAYQNHTTGEMVSKAMLSVVEYMEIPLSRIL
jgi:hypothetical protein